MSARLFSKKFCISGIRRVPASLPLKCFTKKVYEEKTQDEFPPESFRLLLKGYFTQI